MCMNSLNLWMNTEVDHIGYYTVWNSGKAGDHIDLLAVMDVLAVPAICGSGNVWVTSNFSYKPIKLEIFEASAQSTAVAEKEWRTNASLKTQRSPKDFKNATIRTDPELKREPDYKPDFVNYPIVWKNIEVVFTSEEFQNLALSGNARRYRRGGRANPVLPLVPRQSQETRVAVVRAAKITCLRCFHEPIR